MITELTSVQNPVIKRMKSLKDKKARTLHREMLVEGEKLMLEAAQASLLPSDVLIESSQAAKYERLAREMESFGAHVYLAPRHILETACDTKTPQGACGAFTLPMPFDPEHAAPERLVVLDGVQDPGNVGTIWRTADAAGLNGMLLASSGADPFSPKVQRAAMGSGFRVPVRVTDHLASELFVLREQGYRIIVSALDGAPFYEGMPHCEKFALVIGNEARGVSDEVGAVADVRLKLPMRGGAESLNAAVAAGIMMYELMR